MQLYVLESFLARLAATRFADRFVLKGGVLLVAFGERRPTRDIDLQAQDLDNDPGAIRAAIVGIAAVSLDDGVIFDVETATAEVIRDEDRYQGVRVSMAAKLATARPGFHVDVSVGDPITPAPPTMHLPRILGGEIVVRGYPLAMVDAEKIVTAISRGTTSTRWRDFADMYLLARHHATTAPSSANPSAMLLSTATSNSPLSAKCSPIMAALASNAGRMAAQGAP
jgi:hypothetical protein